MTIGNVVSPTSGVLATIVSADPMYCSLLRCVACWNCAIGVWTRGGFDAVRIRLRLPNGKIYGELGKLTFVDIAVAKDTDTIVLRGTVPNPVVSTNTGGSSQLRELVEDEFVRVSLEAVAPLKVLTIPRVSVLSDQQGDYVFVVTA